jgi:hypothetical protein
MKKPAKKKKLEFSGKVFDQMPNPLIRKKIKTSERLDVFFEDLEGIIYEPAPGQFYLYCQDKGDDGFRIEPKIPLPLMKRSGWKARQKVKVSVQITMQPVKKLSAC